MHLTIGVFGNADFMKKVAKQGTTNDLMIYNHGSSEGVFTYVAPNSESIQPLLQTVNLADVPLIVADEVTKELAEQIIALDAFGFEKGLVLSASEDLRRIIKGTSVEKFVWVSDERECLETLKQYSPLRLVDIVWIPIDNYFTVKSVGTVVLAVMKGGTIKKYDKLTIAPIGKEVMIKGIQSQDKDIDEASAGMRIGLSLKGVEADEFKRGYVICKDAAVSKNVTIEFVKSKYSKESVVAGSQMFLCVGLRVVVGKVESLEGNVLALSLEQPIAYFPKQRCLLASTQPALPRIVGAGTMQ